MGFAKANPNSEEMSTSKKVAKKKQALQSDAVKSSKADVDEPKKKIRKLSKKKRDAIIIEHQEHGKRLAWSFLSGWRVRLPQDEVISVVGAALCEAAIRFDPDRGVAFKTFFFYHLRGMLLKEISRMIEEQKVLQFMPTSIPSDSYQADQLLYGGWNAPLVENNNPERIMEKRQVAGACWEACAKLDVLEQEVLIRFFVYDEPLISIAKELDYCRCHISRVKSRALNKLGGILKDRAVITQRHNAGPEVLEKAMKKAAKKTSRPKKKRSANYTGGRGRRKQGDINQTSAVLEQLLQEYS